MDNKHFIEENKILIQRMVDVFQVGELVSDGIYLSDKIGTVISVNKSYSQITGIQAIIALVENSIYMSEHRLNIALRKLEKVKTKISKLKATDYHGLLSCHEAD